MFRNKKSSLHPLEDLPPQDPYDFVWDYAEYSFDNLRWALDIIDSSFRTKAGKIHILEDQLALDIMELFEELSPANEQLPAERVEAHSFRRRLGFMAVGFSILTGHAEPESPLEGIMHHKPCTRRRTRAETLLPY